MRNILILGHNEAYDTLNVFSGCLKKGLERSECRVDFLNTGEDDETVAEILRLCSEESYSAVITFNAYGQENYCIDGENLWEQLGIPFINYIVDHPVEHQRELQSECRCQHILCMDIDHIGYINTYYPNVASVHFLPLGGMEISGYTGQIFEEYKERPIDVIFTGTHEELTEYENAIAGYPPAIRNMIVYMLKKGIEERGLSYEELFESAMQSLGLSELPAEEKRTYAVITRIVSRYLRAYYREEAVRYIMGSGIKLHVFGNGWNNLLSENTGNAVIHEPVSYEKSVRLYSDSKIVLNIMPLFKNGSHDRIPTTMLCGAAVLSDHSRYIDEYFKDRIFYYDIESPEILPYKIKDILSKPEEAYSKITDNLIFAQENLTWDNVAKKVLDIIEEIRC